MNPAARSTTWSGAGVGGRFGRGVGGDPPGRGNGGGLESPHRDQPAWSRSDVLIGPRGWARLGDQSLVARLGKAVAKQPAGQHGAGCRIQLRELADCEVCAGHDDFEAGRTAAGTWRRRPSPTKTAVSPLSSIRSDMRGSRCRRVSSPTADGSSTARRVPGAIGRRKGGPRDLFRAESIGIERDELLDARLQGARQFFGELVALAGPGETEGEGPLELLEPVEDPAEHVAEGRGQHPDRHVEAVVLLCPRRMPGTGRKVQDVAGGECQRAEAIHVPRLHPLHLQDQDLMGVGVVGEAGSTGRAQVGVGLDPMAGGPLQPRAEPLERGHR